MSWRKRALGFEVTETRWRAVFLETTPVRARVIDSRQGEFDRSEALVNAAADALNGAAHELDVPAGTPLAVALARPLVHTKELLVPSGPRDAVREALQGEANSIFPLGRAPLSVDVRARTGIPGRRSDRPSLAAGAPADLTEAVAACAEALDLELAAIDLGAAALRMVLPRRTRGVVLVRDSGAEWVEYGGRGTIRASLYFPFGPDGAEQVPRGPTSLRAWLPAEVAEALEEGARCVLLGPAEKREPTLEGHHGPSRRSDDVFSRPPAIPGLEDPRFAVACAAALQALGDWRTFDLRPDGMRRHGPGFGRPRTWLLAAAIVAALGSYMLASYHDAWTRARLLEAELQALEPAVQRVLATRDSVLAMRSTARALARLVADQPRWTAVLAELARVLPRDAHLARLSRRRDGLRVEGHAAATSEVVRSLEASAMFASVAIAGPVTRDDRRDGGTERFALDLELSPVEGSR